MQNTAKTYATDTQVILENVLYINFRQVCAKSVFAGSFVKLNRQEFVGKSLFITSINKIIFGLNLFSRLLTIKGLFPN